MNSETMTRFGVLGDLCVPADLAAGPPRGPKVRAIFALLLLRANQTVTTDALMAELWGSGPPASAPATVRSHVYHLRTMLGDRSPSEANSLIVTQPTGYLLCLPDQEIDANVFL